jgi:hypothetical protein
MGKQMLTMKSEVVGRPSVVSDDLYQSAAPPPKKVKTALHNFRTFA